MVLQEILVYNPKPGPRFTYILEFIQSLFDQVKFVECLSLDFYLSWPGPSLQYGSATLKQREYRLFRSDLLDLIGNTSLNLKAYGSGRDFKLFKEGPSDEFDLIAACFYLLSRSEEYGKIPTDLHGRYASFHSLLVKHDILEIPIVDHWIRDLGKKLELFFHLPFSIKKSTIQWTVGVDIDHFYKHQYKSIYMKMGGSLIHLVKGQFRELSERIEIYTGHRKDPYDSLDIIQHLVPPERLTYFILAGGKSSYDKNQSILSDQMARKLRDMNQSSRIGLHPSYHAGSKGELLLVEKTLLGQQAGCEILQSRFHYLKFRIPDSFRLLINAGIREDHSLGYPDRVGFRAGTCHSFHWFDLEENKKTDLVLYPFAVMDRTLKDHLKLKGEEAVVQIKRLFDICQQYGGQFHLVWHNSSFDFEGEWNGWQHTFEETIAYFKNSRTAPSS